MILHQATLDNPWLRAARLWPFALLFACLIAWATLKYLRVDTLRLWPLWLAVPQGVLLLYLMGRWVTPPSRILALAAIVGGFAYLPFLVALFVPLFALLVLDAPNKETLATAAAVLLLLVYWVVANVRQLRTRLIDSRFIEHEFKAQAERIVLDRRPKTTLDTMHFRSEPAYLLGALLVFATPMAYLAAHLADEYAGPRGTLLQVAVLATPLAIHVLGHMTRGCYLWIYTIWKLERAHGKPVHLLKLTTARAA